MVYWVYGVLDGIIKFGWRFEVMWGIGIVGGIRGVEGVIRGGGGGGFVWDWVFVIEVEVEELYFDIFLGIIRGGGGVVWDWVFRIEVEVEEL